MLSMFLFTLNLRFQANRKEGMGSWQTGRGLGRRPAPGAPPPGRAALSPGGARRVRRGAAAAGRRRGPYFAGLPACRADRRGPAGLGDAGAFLAAGFLAAGFLADLAAGLGAGAFFGVALGLATVCGGVARERRSIGRASEDEGTASTPSSGRSHGDAVASMALQGTRQNAPSSSPAPSWPRASWPRASWRTSWPARAPPRARRS